MAQDNALDHLEQEIKELEGVTRWGKPLRWAAGLIIGAAIVGGIVWLVSSPPPTTSSSMAYIPKGAAPIDTTEPRGTTLTDPPTRFAWEQVTGRFQYIVRIYVRGTSNPFLERATTATSFELTPDERARFTRGNTFVWTVVAQGKDGSNIGAGQGSFKVR